MNYSALKPVGEDLSKKEVSRRTKDYFNPRKEYYKKEPYIRRPYRNENKGDAKIKNPQYYEIEHSSRQPFRDRRQYNKQRYEEREERFYEQQPKRRRVEGWKADKKQRPHFSDNSHQLIEVELPYTIVAPELAKEDLFVPPEEIKKEAKVRPMPTAIPKNATEEKKPHKPELSVEAKPVEISQNKEQTYHQVEVKTQPKTLTLEEWSKYFAE